MSRISSADMQSKDELSAKLSKLEEQFSELKQVTSEREAELLKKFSELKKKSSEREAKLKEECSEWKEKFRQSEVENAALKKEFAPINFYKFAGAFHQHFKKMTVETRKKCLTKGTVSVPEGRSYPNELKIADMPDVEGKNIWKKTKLMKLIREDESFKSEREVAILFEPVNLISSEVQLVNFIINNINYPLMKAIENFSKNEKIKKALDLSQKYRIQEHTNLDNKKKNSVKGKNEQADDFLIRSGEIEEIIVCAEYKAPHKLSLDDIKLGLKTNEDNKIVLSEQYLDEQSIAEDNRKEGAKDPIILVLIQLFSSMMKQRLRHGYLLTGEAIVFLWIDEDPTIANFHLVVPKIECPEIKDDSELQNTAIGKIFDFILLALKSGKKNFDWWDDKLKNLPKWTEFKGKKRKRGTGDNSYRGVQDKNPSSNKPSTRSMDKAQGD